MLGIGGGARGSKLAPSPSSPRRRSTRRKSPRADRSGSGLPSRRSDRVLRKLLRKPFPTLPTRGDRQRDLATVPTRFTRPSLGLAGRPQPAPPRQRLGLRALRPL